MSYLMDEGYYTGKVVSIDHKNKWVNVKGGTWGPCENSCSAGRIIYAEKNGKRIV